MNKPLVIIDAGHGGKDPGATANKLREKDINLEVASRVAYFLGNHNIGYAMTRYGDTFLELEERVEIANMSKVALFLSIHCNYATSKEAKGVETWYFEGSTKSKKYADKYQSSLMSLNYTTDRGVRDGRFYVLKYTGMPSVLLELGFLSNPGDAHYLKQPEKQMILAENIFRTTDQFLNPNKYNKFAFSFSNWNPFKNIK